MTFFISIVSGVRLLNSYQYIESTLKKILNRSICRRTILASPLNLSASVIRLSHAYAPPRQFSDVTGWLKFRPNRIVCHWYPLFSYYALRVPGRLTNQVSNGMKVTLSQIQYRPFLSWK